jgi:hypothetical protein
MTRLLSATFCRQSAGESTRAGAIVRAAAMEASVSAFLRRTAAVLVAAAALLALVAAGADAGERIAEAEIAAIFSGMTLDGVYADGTFFSETYKEDGSIRYHDTDGADTGEWSVQDGRFCTFYEDQQGACFVVEKDGANCFTFYAPQEDDKPDSPPEKDWTSRGWDRSKPSTCPTRPEIAI